MYYIYIIIDDKRFPKETQSVVCLQEVPMTKLGMFWKRFIHYKIIIDNNISNNSI